VAIDNNTEVDSFIQPCFKPLFFCIPAANAVDKKTPKERGEE